MFKFRTEKVEVVPPRTYYNTKCLFENQYRELSDEILHTEKCIPKNFSSAFEQVPINAHASHHLLSMLLLWDIPIFLLGGLYVI